ncbi:phage holin family protein [Rahnella aceris]|jgi:predicted exporter|uniref:phage holin family protein n=1 Tax=Rahnella sp. (strain Y9602) TaxID=2703885 RepID=UPI001C252DFA|nr:phage holin family protein [Rahnella aceris]MBU9852769.1 holin [Rahnella aceris]
MPNGETSLLTKLLLIGAVIGLGQLMVSNERITVRTLLGRIILGSAVAPIAGIALLQFENMPELAVIGIACGLGILGSAIIEEYFKRWLDYRLAKKKGESHDS